MLWWEVGGWGVGRIRLLLGHLLLLPQSHLVVLVSHLDVVGNGCSVSSAGWELVVVRPVRLEHLHDIQVLALKGNRHWRSVQVVEKSGVGKDVQKMAGALGGSLPSLCRYQKGSSKELRRCKWLTKSKSEQRIL